MYNIIKYFMCIYMYTHIQIFKDFKKENNIIVLHIHTCIHTYIHA